MKKYVLWAVLFFAVWVLAACGGSPGGSFVNERGVRYGVITFRGNTFMFTAESSAVYPTDISEPFTLRGTFEINHSDFKINFLFDFEHFLAQRMALEIKMAEANIWGTVSHDNLELLQFVYTEIGSGNATEANLAEFLTELMMLNTAPEIFHELGYEMVREITAELAQGMAAELFETAEGVIRSMYLEMTNMFFAPQMNFESGFLSLSDGRQTFVRCLNGTR